MAVVIWTVKEKLFIIEITGYQLCQTLFFFDKSLLCFYDISRFLCKLFFGNKSLMPPQFIY